MPPYSNFFGNDTLHEIEDLSHRNFSKYGSTGKELSVNTSAIFFMLALLDSIFKNLINFLLKCIAQN